VSLAAVATEQLFATPAARAGAKQYSEQVCDADD